MRVLINALSAVNGGSITYLRDILPPLSRLFAEQGTHTLSVLLHRSQMGMFDESLPVCWRVIEGTFPRSHRRLIWERQRVEEFAAGEDLYFIPYQVGYVPKTVPTVMMLRNMEPALHWKYPYDLSSRVRNVLLSRLSDRNLRQASRVIAVSSFARDYLMRHVGLAQGAIATIHHGCSSAFRQLVTADDRDALKAFGVRGDYLFTSGSLRPYRRLEDILVAFGRIAAVRPTLQLVITGVETDKRYYAKIMRALRDTGASDRIVFPGVVNSSMMAMLYRNCSAFVAATEIEACPNTIIEAMSSGCAIVAPRLPPMPEFIGDNGLYFKARDQDDLVATLNRLLDDSALRAAIGARAKMASQAFTWERCARETFDWLLSSQA